MPWPALFCLWICDRMWAGPGPVDLGDEMCIVFFMKLLLDMSSSRAHGSDCMDVYCFVNEHVMGLIRSKPATWEARICIGLFMTFNWKWPDPWQEHWKHGPVLLCLWTCDWDEQVLRQWMWRSRRALFCSGSSEWTKAGSVDLTMRCALFSSWSCYWIWAVPGPMVLIVWMCIALLMNM